MPHTPASITAAILGAFASFAISACAPDASPRPDATEATDPADAATADITADPTIDTTIDTSADTARRSDAPDVTSDTGLEPADLPPCPAPLETLFAEDDLDAPRRDSNGYAAPSPASRRAIAQSIAVFAAGGADAATDARRNAELGGYRLCQTSDLVVWLPVAPAEGRARWALRPSGPVAPLVVQAPHPLYDLDTLAESRAIFRHNRTRALLVAGTHRCANAAASSCSGQTGACSEARRPYRVSDMAHNTDTMFQTAHRALADAYPESVVVSIHGFTLEGISLSDGTRQPTRSASPVARLGAALARRLPGVRVTHCNEHDGADHRERFCGTTNVQGRHLNGSSKACTDRAEQASGRFIHLEQTRQVRRSFQPVVEAFGDVFSPGR